MSKALLVLYGTSGCHLCELAEQLLVPWIRVGYTVECVDIADSEDLLQRFGVLIPVLEKAGGEYLTWPFDRRGIAAFLGEEPD